jgi:putative MATE family efflux protein
MEKTRKRKTLAEGDLKKQILSMSLGMVMGMMGMSIFNMVDTIFVGQLGKEELAALSFTISIVMVVQGLSLGLGMGLSATLSRYLGAENMKKAELITRSTLVLGILMVLTVSLVGKLTIKPLFTLLGAPPGNVMKNINAYMSIWYFTSVVVIIPILGNNVIRATGDTKTPSLVMLVAATVNLILDPLLIFGWGPFPVMGVAGAALATALSRSITMVISLYILIKREKLLIFEKTSLTDMLGAWKEVLHIGIPNALIKIITPLATGIITGLLARYSLAAVAGFGAGVRAEMMALAFTVSVGAAIGPFIGQNIGARRWDRVQEGTVYAGRLAFISGTVVFLIMLVIADLLAMAFSKDPEVRRYIALYLRIAGLGYGMRGVFQNIGTILNVLKRPFHSTGITIIQMFVIYIPLAFLGARFVGIAGIFAALAFSYILMGFISIKMVEKQIGILKETSQKEI